MLEKVIELGAEVRETGERRVCRLDAGLVKTASSEIQQFWDSIERNPASQCFLWVIGVSAAEYYGCNNNGDAFSEHDLRDCHHDFVTHAHVFLHHVNKDPARSIGTPVYSWYNEAMHRIELILRVEKKAPGAELVVVNIAQGRPVYVSMGCRVKYDVCSICGNKAPTRAQYCDHLRYNLRKILPDGRQVFAHNPCPSFFDISIVSRPADPMAHTLDKLASERRGDVIFMDTRGSAELGEQAAYERAKLAGMGKLADIIKLVDGRSIEEKGGETEDAPEWASNVRNMVARGFEDVEFPHLEPECAENMGLSPAGLLLAFASCGAVPGFCEAAWMAGRSAMGRRPKDREIGLMLRLLPPALSLLSEHPGIVDDIADEVASSYNGEFELPARRMLILRVIRPIAEFRVLLDGLEKNAEFGQPHEREVPEDFLGMMDTVLPGVADRFPRFSQLEFVDGYGNTKVTTPYHLRASSALGKIFKGGAVLGAGALALGSIGALLYERGLANRLLYATAAAVPAATLASLGLKRDGPLVVSTRGVEVPGKTLLSAWGTTKTAGKMSVLTAAGMFAPAGLALDYGYNWWRYGRRGIHPESELGSVGRVLQRAGKYSLEHPFVATMAGGTLGALLAKGRRAQI